MKYDSKVHHRRSVRLQGYDYAQEGWYYVTICTFNKACIFGNIVKGGRGKTSFVPTAVGKVAEQCWYEIPQHYSFVSLDAFVVMPNHIHGIFIIERNIIGANDYLPLQQGTSQTVGAIVRGYKIGVTKWARAYTSIITVWQRNYYEHIIRNENDLTRTREYIVTNPERWEEDELFAV